MTWLKDLFSANVQADKTTQRVELWLNVGNLIKRIVSRPERDGREQKPDKVYTRGEK